MEIGEWNVWNMDMGWHSAPKLIQNLHLHCTHILNCSVQTNLAYFYLYVSTRTFQQLDTLDRIFFFLHCHFFLVLLCSFCMPVGSEVWGLDKQGWSNGISIIVRPSHFLSAWLRPFLTHGLYFLRLLYCVMETAAWLHIFWPAIYNAVHLLVCPCGLK